MGDQVCRCQARVAGGWASGATDSLLGDAWQAELVRRWLGSCVDDAWRLEKRMAGGWEDLTEADGSV